MKKSLLTILALLVASVLVLSSCGGDDVSSDSSKASSEASTEESKDTSAEASEEASADESKDTEASADESTDASADSSSEASTEVSEDASEETSEDSSAGTPDPGEVALEIGTVEEFNNFAASVNAGETFEGKKVVLTADLDFTDLPYVPVGYCDAFGANPQRIQEDEAAFAQCPYFGGYFDGQGHVIKGLFIEMVSGGGGGLFGMTRGATIKNLGVDAEVLIYEIPCSAIMVAWASDTLIESCYVDGSIDISIEDCNDVGGFISLTHGNCVIRNCYSKAYLMSSYTVGSIACFVWDGSLTIENCYTVGDVDTRDTAYLNCGYIVGSRFPNTTKLSIENCYYLPGACESVGNSVLDVLESEQENVHVNAMGVSESEMKECADDLGSAFKADTENINEGYPVLSWQ